MNHRRRVIEVHGAVPTSHDDAVVKRNALIKEVQDIQAQLGAAKEDEPQQVWRRNALHALNAKQNELRRIKDWLRKNDAAKKGEWELLGRAYHVIEGLRDQQAMPDDHGGEIDALLDAIEKTIPGKYLETTNDAR